MSCIGLGVDIVGVEKFSHIAEKRGNRLLDRLFTHAERKHCDDKYSRYEAYSARFAAKEAFLKALGTGLRDGLTWREIEVVNDKFGKPDLNISGKAKQVADNMGAKKCSLSMSHTGDYAVAVVVIED